MTVIFSFLLGLGALPLDGNKAFLVVHFTRIIWALSQYPDLPRSILWFCKQGLEQMSRHRSKTLDTQICFINSSCCWMFFFKMSWAVCCVVKAFGASVTTRPSAEKYGTMSLMSTNVLRETTTRDDVKLSVLTHSQGYGSKGAWHLTELLFICKVNVSVAALKQSLAVLRWCKQTKVTGSAIRSIDKHFFQLSYISAWYQEMQIMFRLVSTHQWGFLKSLFLKKINK